MSAAFRIDGRCALVTGASSGLGWHFAKVLSEAGAAVALLARRRDRLEELAGQIRAQGGEAFVVTADVRERAAVEAALDEVWRDFRPVDVLINNSGIARSRALLEQTQEDWETVIDTNLSGLWWVGQGVARRMAARGAGGAIVNVASTLGIRIATSIPAYVASKAAVIHLTKAMAVELAPHRIRVNALAPGYLATELNSDFFESDAGKALLKRIPARRLADPAELDGPLLLLASDASSFMTGSTLVVDGGYAASGP